MAATDKHYRNQNMLDVVFAVSCILMLVSIVGMFMQDYFREYKSVQRTFRDVKPLVHQRLAADALVDLREARALYDSLKRKYGSEKVARAKLKEELQKRIEEEYDSPIARVRQALKSRNDNEGKIAELNSKVNGILAKVELTGQNYQMIKAELSSKLSFYDIEVERHGADSPVAKILANTIADLKSQLAEAKDKKDDVETKLLKYRKQVQQLEASLTEATGNLSRSTDKFVTQVNAMIDAEWTIGDLVRTLPVIDAFASPIKIHQYTINDIPIDYNFMHVTRFDRCVSCHQGIDNASFSKPMLRGLSADDVTTDVILDIAKELLATLRSEASQLPKKITFPDPDRLKLGSMELNESQITQFAAHPRLDLFVGPNSKHPAESFGCTSCHQGQGSATSFVLASHTPNTARDTKEWKEAHGWESSHFWDFPMLPNRFIESSCLKCHYEVTDLISHENRVEAPKVIHGYELIKSFGCYGCHEIHGRNKGRRVGPDLRLEPTPPLEDMLTDERNRLTANPDNAPGDLRKVGPSLYRVSEKTNEDWVRKWLLSPRSFRPDTKMPHYYGLSNNSPDVLPESQKRFPDTEIRAIAHYLFNASREYVDKIKNRNDLADKEAAEQDRERLMDLVLMQSRGLFPSDLKEKQKLLDEMERIKERIRLRKEVVLTDLTPDDYVVDDSALARGRAMFIERGCLACHRHEATSQEAGAPFQGGNYSPAITSHAQFGPDLSQLKAKLVASNDKKSMKEARIWLTQWIKNPHVHSPRSNMPVTHLTNTEAADIASWLLSQDATRTGEDWDDLEVSDATLKDYQNLATVYLSRILPSNIYKKLYAEGKMPAYIAEGLPIDEKKLVQDVKRTFGEDKGESSLKTYVGKKALNRLGCFGCHDIPGFDTAKPIGTGLNDWGKKETEKLQFADINHFMEHHFVPVDGLVRKSKDGKVSPWPAKLIRNKKGKLVEADLDNEKAKQPYEKFYYDSLLHRHREGYLNQKLVEPRSYDHKKILAWDDRARMPQFRFSRLIRAKGESDKDYAARKWKVEAEKREAISTFVLGLVAEPVPEKMVNLPKGDRLAQVKGRQVLEKYNCAGCHLVRPGVYDFEYTPSVQDQLEKTYYDFFVRTETSTEYPEYKYHDNWYSDLPASKTTLKVFGTNSAVDEGTFSLRLAHGLRFHGAVRQKKDPTKRDVGWYNFPAYSSLLFPGATPADSEIGVLNTPEKLAKYEKAHGPYGGAFSELLTNYLVARDSWDPNSIFKKNQMGIVWSAGPPVLLFQGERTQSEWLYRFLLNPQKVRRMTVLQMPRFNMSKDEAQDLVAYFAAVTRLNNPSLNLQFPNEKIPQRDLDDDYWVEQNKEYMKRLQTSKMVGDDGNVQQVSKLKLEELQPIWQNILEDFQSKKKVAVERAKEAEEQLSTLQKEQKKLEMELKEAEGKKEIEKGKIESLTTAKKVIDRKVEIAKAKKDILENRVIEFEKEIQTNSVEKQKKQWEKVGAYQADSFRMLASNLCLNCHKLGPLIGPKSTEGPPLDLAWKRLRPDWLKHWVSHPQRFLPFDSPMPPNFDMKKMQYQEYFYGPAIEQITAVRDALMAYPQLEALPVNQRWLLPRIGEKK